jgi:hypothetical protein
MPPATRPAEPSLRAFGAGGRGVAQASLDCSRLADSVAPRLRTVRR